MLYIIYLLVACSPGSYGSTLVSSFLESGNGDYIEELTSQCNKCPLGTYQENGGQSSCVSCPSGHTTVDMGSIEQSNCQGKMLYYYCCCCCFVFVVIIIIIINYRNVFTSFLFFNWSTAVH